MPFLLYSARRVLGMRVRMPPGDFQTFRLPRNLTYGRFDDYLEDVCRRVRQEFGFVVDPIYGAKSWSAMEEYVDATGISGNESAMFWHCGYSPDWESFRNR
jgi:1-aminocyclopropane-1-carboxylate deaminase/D-cysteine desulfhydrase-like pyridoxal-dependent ACC family enzyme